MVQEEQPEMTEAKPPRRVLRLVLLSLLIAVLALVAAPFIYISNAGGLAGLMQAELSRRLGGAQVVVGDVDLGFDLSSLQLTVTADNVGLTLDGGSLTVPRSSVVLTPRSLLIWAPSDIVLGGLDLDLTLDPESWRKSPLGAVAASVAAPAPAGADDTLPGRQITIASASLTLRDHKGQAQPVRIENIEAEFAAAADGTFVGLFKGDRLENGAPAGNLSISAIGDLTRKDFRIDITMNELATTGLATMSPVLPTLLADAGRISGTASLAITAGDLDAADMDIVAVEGGLDLAVVGFSALAYDTASVVIGYNHRDGALSLAQGELALTDGRTIALSGNLRDLHTDMPQLAFRFRGNRWPVDRIYDDWPERLAPELRAALMQRATGGQLENFELEISGGFQRSEAAL